MQASWMILASLFFSMMGVCIKYASAHFHTFELVFFRGLIGVVFMAWICRMQGITLRTPIPMMHVWRSVVGVTSLAAWFYALGHLPLSTAMTLNYMSGVWVAVFLVGGTLLSGKLREIRRQVPIVLAVLAGFGGVVLLLRPTIEQDQWVAGVVGLLSGLIAALAYIQVAALGRLHEPEARTVFYFSVGTTVVGAALMLITGMSTWLWPSVLWLLPVGVLAALGQLCMTKAYSRGSTMVVANLQYSGIVFGALFGLLLFGDQIALMGWLGMALIMASGIASTILRNRALPRTPD
ncbi:DMT family transporter [Limnohabitans sp. WS1]|uniref:DMT family transporter n=1 Tax=Limnohabitans sp. WS1 TaxID=1100726 RepID=UPI000BCD6FEC|nr:DMT family transporter [Limnohabitans sp. WS1]OYU13347.1 MAG: EamA family transporter [Comamonadaceae bacterium PBBC1]PUE20086.1 EamA family transporter [Limnohabitans sp. WS1]